jgi:anti-sigma factor RsiW
MSRRRLEKQVGAYRDGALPARQAEMLRQRLESDPEARLELARHEALGRLTREAWREGPPSPSAEMLIASLRGGMRRIDAELEQGRSVRRWSWLAAPASLIAVGAAAALVVLAIARPDALQVPAPGAAPALAARSDSPSSAPMATQTVSAQTEPESEIPVYDLAQGKSPLMLFENQGTTFIWLIQPEKRGDDVSALPGGWV